MSLRRRLGLIVGGGAFAILAAAVLTVTVERWREATARLGPEIELAAFDGAATDTLDVAPPMLDGGDDVIVVVLDGNASVLVALGRPDQLVLDVIEDDVYLATVEQDLVVTETVETGRGEVTVAGVACVDPSICDTYVVGATERSVIGYVLPRIGWMAGLAVLGAAVSAAAAVWAVGRSLRPVEVMRGELESVTATDLHRRVPVPGTGDELTELGTTMNDTLHRLDKAVSANERFVADAAHELRSPLAGIRAAVEMEASRQGPGILDDVLVEVDRSTRLVDDLLVLARRSGQRRDTTEVDLDDLVRGAARAAGRRHPEADIEADLTPVRIEGDPDALTRVVTNLLENALRYGDGACRVTVAEQGDRAVLSVEDDGPGIPGPDRERVLERFARLDGARARATGGSGLGLAIVAELVDDHGGEVTIGDGPLGGAAVVVRLPLPG